MLPEFKDENNQEIYSFLVYYVYVYIKNHEWLDQHQAYHVYTAGCRLIRKFHLLATQYTYFDSLLFFSPLEFGFHMERSRCLLPFNMYEPFVLRG